MKRNVGVFVLALYGLTLLIPSVWADTGSWLMSTKDKTVRGIENGVFGMGGELYHHLSTSDKGTFKGIPMAFMHGLHKGLIRTLVGAYELATPYYHDAPVLSDLDSVVKS